MGLPARLTSQGYRRTLGLPSWLHVHFAVLLLLLMVESTMSGAFDYRRIDCGDRTHTMVRFPKAGRGPNCQEYLADYLSQSEKDFILHKHNEYRNIIALGQYRNLSTAADMMEMVWDEELATIAQRWADQCEVVTNDCNDVPRFPVDRTYFLRIMDSVNEEFPMENEYGTIIKDLFYQEDLGLKGPKPIVVWGLTYSLGCGRSRYRSDRKYFKFLICMYGPKGDPTKNVLYTEGTPCSKCPGPCSARYLGLCEVSF